MAATTTDMEGEADALSADRAPFMLLSDCSWSWRLRLAITGMWVTTIWTYRVVLPQPPGWRRFLVALPAIATHFMLPFLFHPFDEPLTMASISFLTFRMPATKIIALCFARGPLAAPSLLQRLDQSLATFLIVCPVVARTGSRGVDAAKDAAAATGHEAPNTGPAATPHSPAQHQGPQAPAPAASQRLSRTLSDAYSSAGDAAANRATLLREMAAKWAAFGALTAVAACGYPAPFLQLRMPSGATGQHGSHQGLCGPVALPLPPLLHRLALHAALFSGMAAMVGGMMDAAALYATWRWHVDLVPPFRRPFMATSLGDFWSKRWNLTQSRVLRGLVYEPVFEGRLLHPDHHRHHAIFKRAQQQQVQQQVQEQQQRQRQGAGGVGWLHSLATPFLAATVGATAAAAGGQPAATAVAAAVDGMATAATALGAKGTGGGGSGLRASDLNGAAASGGGGGGSLPADGSGSGDSGDITELASDMAQERGRTEATYYTLDPYASGDVYGGGSGSDRSTVTSDDGIAYATAVTNSGAGSRSFGASPARQQQGHSPEVDPGSNTPSCGLRATDGFDTDSYDSDAIDARKGTMTREPFGGSRRRQVVPPTPSSVAVRRRMRAQAAVVRQAGGDVDGEGGDALGGGGGQGCGGAADCPIAAHGRTGGAGTGGGGAPEPRTLASVMTACVTSLAPLLRAWASVTSLVMAVFNGLASMAWAGAMRLQRAAAATPLWRRVLRPAAAPLRRVVAVARRPAVRKPLAVLAVFVWSGLEHELFLWYLQRSVSWRWFTFFAVHGLLVVAEQGVRDAAAALGDWAEAQGFLHEGAAEEVSYWLDEQPWLRSRTGRKIKVKAVQAVEWMEGKGWLGAGGGGSELRGWPHDSSPVGKGGSRWGRVVPAWVGWVVTLGVLEVTASWWFFDVLMELGVVTCTGRILQEAVAVVRQWGR